ncbi:hypothetical protein IWX58_004828 [Rubrivivax gelatinosus]|uniref:hypothetical protein n=1 Tax=Rubrivivax gelatinosus TaxID=28068 RepID=UPI0012FE5C58|nr:hypothetical protein [Rubrivivax gelatinosus]MBG6083078.1 hypothetical protein [Rubrivivax gelatinosus]
MAEVLASAGRSLNLERLAGHFNGRGRWCDSQPMLLDTLVALGRARLADGDRVARQATGARHFALSDHAAARLAPRRRIYRSTGASRPQPNYCASHNNPGALRDRWISSGI